VRAVSVSKRVRGFFCTTRIASVVEVSKPSTQHTSTMHDHTYLGWGIEKADGAEPPNIGKTRRRPIGSQLQVQLKIFFYGATLLGFR
jgi:hypothetical protein